MPVNMNQFKQGSVVGMLDLQTNPNPPVMTVRYDSEVTSTLRLVPGEGVVLKDLGADDPGGIPFVDKRSTDAIGIKGIMLFGAKTNSIAPGDILQIAGQGAVIYLEASEAIPRDSLVSLVIASPGQIAVRVTEEILGIALDKAAASGDLIRVEITARGFAELALYELST